MKDILTLLFLIIGSGFMLLAGIGILRMPDLFLRMSTTTKAATMGVGCIMIAAAVHFADVGITSRLLATIFFVFLTASVAAHMIGRAGYSYGVPLWEGTVIDELRGRYDEGRQILYSSDQNEEALPKDDQYISD